MASVACAILFAVLVLLGVMQYRWIAELRRAERRQLEVSLKATADQFADDFAGELLRVVTAFQVEYRSPSESLSRQLRDAHEQWVGSARDPKLIRDLLIVRVEESVLQAYRFDVKTGTLMPGNWPEVLDPLKPLKDYSHPPKGMTYAKSPIFLEAIPALAVPFLVTDPPPPKGKRRTEPPPPKDIPGWSVVQLDRDLIVGEMLPALFRSHFAVADPPPYRIAVASAALPHRIVYQSDAMSEEDLNAPDLVLDLVSKAGGELKTDGPQTTRILAIESPQWQLFVKHRLGSLDAAVEDLRRRNLGIGAAILLVLASSVILILLSASRVRNLGRVQLEFAAAISHELRTPLAVIQAASYNLQEGVIEDKAEVKRYAGLVRDAGRRLSKMVDQILVLAESRSVRRKIAMGPVNAVEVIDKALDSISATLPEGHLPLQKDIPPNLPLVKADALLLSHCIQNLITNAVKYGEISEEKPLQISAAPNREKGEVEIRVSDRGPGINHEDFPHIFKPFYRGKQSHLDPAGNGLGLAVVLQLMEMQLGTLSVQTGPYTGSTFVLHIAIAS
jgi:signal transduction histidine kinase